MQKQIIAYFCIVNDPTLSKGSESLNVEYWTAKTVNI